MCVCESGWPCIIVCMTSLALLTPNFKSSESNGGVTSIQPQTYLELLNTLYIGILTHVLYTPMPYGMVVNKLNHMTDNLNRLPTAYKVDHIWACSCVMSSCVIIMCADQPARSLSKFHTLLFCYTSLCLPILQFFDDIQCALVSHAVPLISCSDSCKQVRG